MFWLQFTIFLIILFHATGFKLNDVSYYDMPRVYQLEDYVPCKLQKGVYCYGTFELLPYNNPSMMQALQNFSSTGSLMLNYTRLLRGYCLNRTCSNIKNNTDILRFSKCVSQNINEHYNLSTRPLKEPYCFTEDTTENITTVDIAFLGVVSMLVIFNIIGTLYDFNTSEDNKRNKYLLAWSVSSNWAHIVNNKRRSEDHRALEGLKSIIGLVIMHVHLISSYTWAFTSNTEIMENFSPFEKSFIRSITTVLLAFSWISSYLLVTVIVNLKNRRSFFREYLIMTVYRIVRILPVTMFGVFLQGTWWRHAGSGPMWHSVVSKEAENCRKYWWTHLLFVNNFWQSDEKCLTQTWYIAADMQVFLLMLPLLLLISKFKTSTALKIIPALFCASLLLLFGITYMWDFKPFLYIDMKHMSTQWSGVKSFYLLYTASYTCLPVALTGAWCAFAVINIKKRNIQLTNIKWFPFLHFCSMPLYLAWLSASHWIQDIRDQLFVAAYSIVSQLVFAVLLSILLMGLILGLRGFYDFLLWDIWRIPSRMSLAVLVLHLSFCLILVASSHKENELSYIRCMSEYAAVCVFTYLAALATTVLLESPFIRTFNILLIKSK